MFVPIFPSNHREKIQGEARVMSRTSGSYLWQVKKLLRRSKAPKIIGTSPAGEEENHEK
jgi:hypothetical protein